MRTILAVIALSLSAYALDPPGEAAPKFRAKTLDGEAFDNESLKGKIVLIQFWTTWCGYCRADEPAVERATEEHADKVVVLAVNVGESRSKVRSYLDSSPRKSKIILTENTNLAAAFQARSFPMYVVLNASGKVAATHAGAATPVLRRLLARGGLN